VLHSKLTERSLLNKSAPHKGVTATTTKIKPSQKNKKRKQMFFSQEKVKIVT
jgi:hypothetical protein